MNKKCAGLQPGDSCNKLQKVFNCEGKIGEDIFESKYCTEKNVDDDLCCDQSKYESCIQREAIGRIGQKHYYGGVVYNCNQWARDVITKCQKEACGK